MVTTLIRYGFMGSKTEMDAIMKPVFNLIDGTKDIPFAPGKGTGKVNLQKNGSTAKRVSLKSSIVLTKEILYSQLKCSL